MQFMTPSRTYWRIEGRLFVCLFVGLFDRYPGTGFERRNDPVVYLEEWLLQLTQFLICRHF